MHFVHPTVIVRLWLKYIGLSVLFSIQAVASEPNRIISLAPYITETLYALGAEEKIIAVSRYCRYPRQAQLRPQVGDLFSADIEQIIALKPDVIFVSPSHHALAKKLIQLGITVKTIKAQRLHDIQEMIRYIADIVGHQQQGKAILQQLDTVIHHLQQKIPRSSPTTVLISLVHHINIERSPYYIAGTQDFYHDLLPHLKVNNAYTLPHPAVPALSKEGLYSLDPDIIIALLPTAESLNTPLPHIQQHWHNLQHLRAVRQQRLYFLSNDYTTIPGPRIGRLLYDLAVILYPDISWQPYSTLIKQNSPSEIAQQSD